MDQSLDDIIKGSKGKFSLRRGGGGGRGAKRGGSGGARGTGRGGAGGNRRRSGGQGASPRGGVQKRGRANASSYSRGPLPDVWSHDKFSEAPTTRNVGGGARGGGTGKLMISNLDFGVNDSDIHELFAEFGPMKKAAVHYDKSGRSLGTAEVVYERQSDATKAMKQYNNVPLDGRAMAISMVGAPAVANSVPANRRLGQRPGGNFNNNRQSGGRGGGGGASARGSGGRGRGGRGGGRGRGRGPPPSADSLDAELDAYRNKMDTA